MNRLPKILVLVLLAGGGTWAAFAQEQPAEGEATRDAQPSRQQAAGEDSADADEGSRPSDREFVPSEKIPADASIAFPVDI